MATGSNISSDTCSICTEQFKLPKLLPCFHTFCLECLQQFVSSSSKDGQFPCPLCRYQVTLPGEGVTGFQTNFYIEVRAEKQQVHSRGECCWMCEQRATHSCRECEILLCDTCTKGHRIVPVSRSHLLKILNDFSTEETCLTKQTFCEKHKDEKRRFYCLPCSKVICRDCKLTNHEGHKTKDIDDVVEEARTSLTKTKVELEMCKAKIEKSIDNNEMSKHIIHVKEEINTLADSLVDMINTARRQEIDRVTVVEKIHGKNFPDEQYNRLTQRKCFLQSQIDRTDAMLKDGLDSDVLTADSEMKQRLAEIEKEQLIGLDFDSKSLKISDIPSVTPGVLDVVSCAVRNVLVHALPVSHKNIFSRTFERLNVTGSTCGSVYSISFTKPQNALVSYEKECSYFLGLFKKSSNEPTWNFRFDLEEMISEGVQGVIEIHNKENKDNKIPADDYTDLKKPFPYKDTNDNGDTCWVIKEHDWVGIQTASGDVRTLTFNPFADPGQEFKPVDVCWGNNQEIYIVDGAVDVIIVYSVDGGFEESLISFNNIVGPAVTAIAMDTEGNLWVGDSHGKINICEIN